MAEEEFRDWERLCELIWSPAIAQAIHVAVELGIPEILNAGPSSAGKLAEAVGADAWALEAVLRALAAFEVLSFDGALQYELTRMGKLLLRSAPGPSAGEAGEFFETIYRPLSALTHMVKTGDVAFDHVYGKSFYDHLAESRELAAHFYDTMESNAPRRYAGLSSVCDLSGVLRVIDVGGGEGSLLIQILREYPDVRGVVFDLPVACGRARDRIERAGLSERCEVVAGDFLKSVPAGGDLYILAQVLNNWRDEEARRVLLNCRAAMEEGARLLILEHVYTTGPLPRWRTLVSLGVMAQRGGRTRSEAQLRALLTATGFLVDHICWLHANATCAIEAKL